MAERRMFAKTIIDSDAFLDMPLSTQALYFHLSMRADDEGFLNNPKKIMRMVGASEDDMKVLLTKKFVIAFESGVVVIKHWRIHNYIRSDRLVETKYQEERQMLDVKQNGAYTMASEIKELEDADAKDKRKIAYKDSSLPYSFTDEIDVSQMSDKCQSSVRQESAQVRLGKDSIGKVRLGKDSIEGAKRFQKPTLEEVRAYCEERGNNVNPERFVDYYESNGWKVGRNPMKDWKASVRTWEQKDKPKQAKQQSYEEMMANL